MNSNTKKHYRENVQMWIYNKGKFLIAEESTKNNLGTIYWKFPHGGVEKGEELLDAVKRELKEELSILSFEVMAQAKYQHYFDWPLELQKKKGYHGQHQHYFLIYPKNINEIKFNPSEIDQIKWLSFKQTIQQFTIPNQIESAQKVWLEFKPIIEQKLKIKKRITIKND